MTSQRLMSIKSTLVFMMGCIVGVVARHTDLPMLSANHIIIVGVSTLAFFAAQQISIKSIKRR